MRKQTENMNSAVTRVILWAKCAWKPEDTLPAIKGPGCLGKPTAGVTQLPALFLRCIQAGSQNAKIPFFLLFVLPFFVSLSCLELRMSPAALF